MRMKIYYFSYFMMIWLLCSCKSILYVVPSPLEGQVVDQLESKMLVSPSVLDIEGQWELAENPLFMKRELPLSDGQILEVHRLERPQLLIDHRGVPTVMYAATSIGNVNPKNDGSSFNVQISLIKK